MIRLAIATFVLALGAPQEPADGVVAVRAGRIHTVSGAVIENGVILIEKGRITEVRAGTEVPAGAKVIDASRQTVIPGLVDVMRP